MSLIISILGGDIRLYYMALRLSMRLEDVCIPYQIKCFCVTFPAKTYLNHATHCNDLSELLYDCDILICPVPFRLEENIPFTIQDLMNAPLPKLIAGGAIPKYFVDHFKETHLIFDVMKDNDFLAVNSALTAEGLLKDIIEKTNFSIEHAKILIAGYGRCGSQMAKKLDALGGKIFFFDKNHDKISAGMNAHYTFYDLTKTPFGFEDFDIIINTIPSPVFKAPFLRALKQDCVLFETASSPGGFDDDICHGLALKKFDCPQIPGKTAPKSAGFALADCIFQQILQLSFRKDGFS